KILKHRRLGIRIGSENDIVGGTQTGAGNIIAFGNADTFDLGNGVLFDNNGDGNAVRRNSIFGYGEGISFTNFSTPIPRAPTPVLTTTGGTLSGAKPNTSYTIEFFSNPDCFFRQGKTFISDTTVLTDGNGNSAAPFTIPGGQNVTATASAAGENTSRFSDCLTEAAA